MPKVIQPVCDGAGIATLVVWLQSPVLDPCGSTSQRVTGLGTPRGFHGPRASVRDGEANAIPWPVRCAQNARPVCSHPRLFSSPFQPPTDHGTFLFLFQMWPQNCSQRKTLSSQYRPTGAGSESLVPTLFVGCLRGTGHCHRAARTQPFTTKTRGPCP